MEGKYVQQFKKGSLEMILLCLIAQRETYGYEIHTRSRVARRSRTGICPGRDYLSHSLPATGTGLVQTRLAPAAANGGTKKYYSLTEKGQQILEELTSFWADYTQCVDGFIAQWKESVS